MKYLLSTNKLKGELLFEYGEDGIIAEFTCQAKLTEEQLIWLSKNFPVTESTLISQSKRFGWQLKKIEEDLSFESFWERYNHKVGNKKRAERLWNQLSKKEKAKAMAFLKRYESYLNQNPGIAKLYPETYLNQQRWNN